MAAAASAAVAAVKSSAFVAKPKALVAVQELKIESSSKERFTNWFLLHCNSEDGKKLKEEIIANFKSVEALESMPTETMLRMYLATELANIETMCAAYDEEGHDPEEIEAAEEKWKNIASRVQAARALQEYKNAMGFESANALEVAAVLPPPSWLDSILRLAWT